MSDLKMDSLEMVVDKAPGICSNMFLFEAILMQEDGIRLFLDIHNITNEDVQDCYLVFVKKYDRQTEAWVV